VAEPNGQDPQDHRGHRDQEQDRRACEVFVLDAQMRAQCANEVEDYPAAAATPIGHQTSPITTPTAPAISAAASRPPPRQPVAVSCVPSLSSA
jgi:hypothetical protein